MSAETPQYPQRTPEELAAQKRRNVWLALALIGFLVLAFLITISRIRDGIYWRMPEHSSDVVSKPDPDFVPYEERGSEALPQSDIDADQAVETEAAGPSETPESDDE